jgi:Zn-dependent peptidase ImmA (M78 family)
LQQAEFKCPWIDPEDLWRIADEARAEYWSENSFPINMEDIIEIKLRLSIDFKSDLKSDFDIIAYLENDMSGIVVDHAYYTKENLANPLRFALAHEMGHYILHKDLYKSLQFTSPQEWITFTMSLPEKVYSAFECQANEFAGRFLVPRKELKQNIGESIKIIEGANLKRVLRENPLMVLPLITPPMRRYFGVSDDVIERRVQREKLWPPKIK